MVGAGEWAQEFQNFKILSKLYFGGICTRQWQLNKPIQTKFGVQAEIMALLSHAKFSTDGQNGPCKHYKFCHNIGNIGILAGF